MKSSTSKISSSMFNKITVVLIALVAFTGCVKDKFDAPPVGGTDPKGISANISIRSLKELYKIGNGLPKLITDSLIISGVINADDKDGNFYKVITLQDSTAGIQVSIESSSLYATFPVGRRVFIKCKDLYLGEYSGLVQLGGYIDNSNGYPQLGSISPAVAQEKVLPGRWGIPVYPVVININNLDTVKYQNMLVRFDNVEFACADALQTYADAAHLGSLNRILEDCSGNIITVRTSGYSRFASSLTPAGKGDVVGIFTVYKSGNNWTKQLAIRNTFDVELTGTTRCDGTTISTADISMAALRALYTGSTVDAPCANMFRGVVVADNNTANFDSKTVFVQDATAGIAIRLTATNPFTIGDSIEVSTSGAQLSQFKGLLQLNNTPSTNARKVGTAVAVAKPATVAQITGNIEKYESTLVSISGATLTGNGGIYGGNVTLTDGTGSMTLYTKSGTAPATFASASYPTGSRTVVGVIQRFNSTFQISVRSPADIQ